MAREPKTLKLRDGVPFLVKSDIGEFVELSADNFTSNGISSQSKVLDANDTRTLGVDQSMVIANRYTVESGSRITFDTNSTLKVI